MNGAYCQSITNGVFRSTDKGLSWKPIGGPCNQPDTRLIVAINNNIVIAADSEGNIWRTLNSGDDSVFALPSKVVVASPTSILFADTILPCDISTTGVGVFTTCGSYVSISLMHISGPDSLYFLPQNVSDPDSAIILFSPNGARSYSGRLELTLSNDSVILVPLTGTGKAAPTITLSSANLENDTIGNVVFVPIKLSATHTTGFLDLSLHFDTSMLVYKGAYLTDSSKIDLTTASSAGFARLHFDSISTVSQDSIIGYAAFQIFPTTTPCASVLFDSISITNSKGFTCASVNPSFTATICSKVGCGTTTLTDFLRYGKVPTLSIVPNPASGVTAIQSNVDLGQVQIELYDVLGNMVMSTSDILSPSHPTSLNLSTLPSGLLSIHVQSAGIGLSQRLMHLR
jgi:hypothetical protein